MTTNKEEKKSNQRISFLYFSTSNQDLVSIKFICSIGKASRRHPPPTLLLADERVLMRGLMPVNFSLFLASSRSLAKRLNYNLLDWLLWISFLALINVMNVPV